VKRYAVISDVHGNRWALEAVLADIDRAGIPDVLNLGDVVYGPLDPAGTANILLERTYPTVCGNEDRIIIQDDAPSSGTLDFVRDQLSISHTDWLRSLPLKSFVEDIFLCHGTPDSDNAYLLWDVDEVGARLRRSEDVASLLSSLECQLVLCGHDHVPRTIRLRDGPLVVDPGSVGLPAYSDNDPHPHVMETGTPHARYSVISLSTNGWSSADRAVTYDWRSAADEAMKNGRSDWAEWLSTGRASVVLS
jgi:predicted phosphodiesterase